MKLKFGTVVVIATAFLVAPLAHAHCGSCGVGDAKHSHAKAEATIVQTAIDAGSFTTLVAAVKAAGLVETLSSKGPFTVFAPTDEAFEKLPAGTVEGLLADPDKLKTILLYHVLSGEVDSAQVVTLSKATTVQGSDVKISKSKTGVMVNNANVTQVDIRASNGIIHVIDTVLLPN